MAPGAVCTRTLWFLICCINFDLFLVITLKFIHNSFKLCFLDISTENERKLNEERVVSDFEQYCVT